MMTVIHDSFDNVGAFSRSVCVCVCVFASFQSLCIIHYGSLVTRALAKRQHSAAKSAVTL